ncbi:MAG: hypothetical protein P1P88_04020 [Bacteroidales bacterium]|nr:hypothetical protein [Bacteroidales bacterium]
MLRNKVTILITVAVLIAIAIGLQFLKDGGSGLPDSLKAIPDDAAIVLESKNFVNLLNNINNNNQFKLEFSEVKEFSDFFAQAEFIDSLLKTYKDVQRIFDGNQTILSGHISANNQLVLLVVAPVKNEADQTAIKNAVARQIGDKATIRQRLYEQQTIFDVVYFEQGAEVNDFSYTFANGIFIFSQSKILTEEAVRRQNSGFSLATNKGFMSMAKTAGKNAEINIYLNYRTLPKSFKNILGGKGSSFYDFLSGFAEWSEFDMMYKNDAFLMSGFTYSDDSLNNYLNIFKNQKAVENDFLGVLPGNTSAFIAFNFSDAKTWRKAYIEYLQKRGEYARLASKLDNISARYGLDVPELFYGSIEGAVCINWMNTNLINGDQEVIGIMELRDAELMKTELARMKPKDSTSVAKMSVPVAVGNANAYSFTENFLFSYLFGNAFDALEANYYMIYGDNLILAKSIAALQMYDRKVRTGSRLKEDKYFIQFSNSLSSESNIYLYLNFANSKSLIAENLNSKYQNIYLENAQKFSKIQALGFQYGISNNLVFTNFYSNYNAQFRKSKKNIWETQLDTSFSMKPVIVKNHNTGNNEVLIQDDANRLVLISDEGKILWKKTIRGKILGEIYQIDKYKNNKLQYMFNTAQQLHLVDRLGNNVDGFPITFKSPATNGIAIFDYDKDKDYRIVVACANKNVYLLTADGGKVDGWDFGQTKSEVSLPAQHFLFDGKDYIIFADKTVTYIVNRRGETRIKPKSDFEKSPYTSYYFEKGESKTDSRFVTTGKNGDVYFIFLDGLVKKMTLGEFTENHRFVYEDIYGDGVNYFVYTDKNKLYVFNRDKSVRFELKFDEDLKNSLNLYQFGKGLKYIGVSPEGLNQVFLIHPDGKILKGFPMHGNGAFSISKLNFADKGADLNLITGNTDNFIFNYKLPTK